MTPSDRLGVIAPPPLLYLGALVLGLILYAFYPTRPLPPIVARPLGGLLLAVTVPFMVRAPRLMLALAFPAPPRPHRCHDQGGSSSGRSVTWKPSSERSTALTPRA